MASTRCEEEVLQLAQALSEIWRCHFRCLRITLTPNPSLEPIAWLAMLGRLYRWLTLNEKEREKVLTTVAD
jgi:hypothetical protein